MAFFCRHGRIRTPDRRPLEKYENLSCHQKPNFVLKSKVKCFSPTDRWLYWKTHACFWFWWFASAFASAFANLIFYFAVLFNIITLPHCPFTNAFSRLGNDICLQKNVESYQSLCHWHYALAEWTFLFPDEETLMKRNTYFSVCLNRLFVFKK